MASGELDNRAGRKKEAAPRGDLEAKCPPLPFLWRAALSCLLRPDLWKAGVPPGSPRWPTQSGATLQLEGCSQKSSSIPPAPAAPRFQSRPSSQSTRALAALQAEASEEGHGVTTRLALCARGRAECWCLNLPWRLWSSQHFLLFSPQLHCTSFSVGPFPAPSLPLGVLSVPLLFAHLLPASWDLAEGTLSLCLVNCRLQTDRINPFLPGVLFPITV